MMLTDNDRHQLQRLFERSNGKAWEPSCGTRPGGKIEAFVERAISAGYLRRADGRCGFEKFKDAMLAWTDAGRAALRQSAGVDQG